MLDPIPAEASAFHTDKNEPHVTSSPASETTLQMIMQRVIGQDAYTPTLAQIDEIIAQKGKIVDYIREDRKEDHDKFKISSKNGLHYFYGSLVFITVIAGAVLWQKPEYFTQVLSALLGFAGGFGLGQSKKSFSRP